MISWQSAKVNKKLNSWTEIDPETGKKKTLSNSTPVTLVFPSISLDEVKGTDDIALALQSILMEARIGYDSLGALADYVNFGLKEAPKRQIQSGHDFRYSPAQREAIQNFVSLVAKGYCPFDVALENLIRQGVPEAEEVLRVGLNPQSGESGESGENGEEE